jgi:hypothetical protein
MFGHSQTLTYPEHLVDAADRIDQSSAENMAGAWLDIQPELAEHDSRIQQMSS